jgi:hypothetical protein
MMSHRPTLLDPFEVLDPYEVADGSRPRIRLVSLVEEVTEWFDRASILEELALLEELNQPPPWTPEPVDRRWRARGWTDDDHYRR